MHTVYHKINCKQAEVQYVIPKETNNIRRGNVMLLRVQKQIF